MAEATQSRAGSLHLVGGALCFDFANTASGRGSAASCEHLRRYDDLLTWCAHAGSLAAATRKLLADEAAKAPSHAATVLCRAIELREAFRAVAVAIANGENADPGLVAVIVSEAAGAVGAAHLGQRESAVRWGWPEGTADLARPVWPVARSAFDMIENTDPRRLKVCPSIDCGWVFIDRSKNNSRRWCDMRVCGNRAKARRHYRRTLAD